MAQEKAALAGEMSGHIFFSEGYYGFDDAFFAALKLFLEYVSSRSKSVSAVVAETPYYVSTPTIQVQTSDEKKISGIVEQLIRSFKADGYRMIDINGARVYMEGGWGLVHGPLRIRRAWSFGSKRKHRRTLKKDPGRIPRKIVHLP